MRVCAQLCVVHVHNQGCHCLVDQVAGSMMLHSMRDAQVSVSKRLMSFSSTGFRRAGVFCLQILPVQKSGCARRPVQLAMLYVHHVEPSSIKQSCRHVFRWAALLDPIAFLLGPISNTHT